MFVLNVIALFLVAFQIGSIYSCNDDEIIPDQNVQLQSNSFCLFSSSELIFESRMMEVASSASCLGAGELKGTKIVLWETSQNSDHTYVNVWGAVYQVDQSEYDSLISYAQSKSSVVLVSDVQVQLTGNRKSTCISLDFGTLPGVLPFSNNIPNQDYLPYGENYLTQLGNLGVPQDYLQKLRNTQDMQANLYQSYQQNMQNPTGILPNGMDLSGSNTPRSIATTYSQNQNQLFGGESLQNGPLASPSNKNIPNDLTSNYPSFPIGSSSQTPALYNGYNSNSASPSFMNKDQSLLENPNSYSTGLPLYFRPNGPPSPKGYTPSSVSNNQQNQQYPPKYPWENFSQPASQTTGLAPSLTSSQPSQQSQGGYSGLPNSYSGQSNQKGNNGYYTNSNSPTSQTFQQNPNGYPTTTNNLMSNLSPPHFPYSGYQSTSTPSSSLPSSYSSDSLTNGPFSAFKQSDSQSTNPYSPSSTTSKGNNYLNSNVGPPIPQTNGYISTFPSLTAQSSQQNPSVGPTGCNSNFIPQNGKTSMPPDIFNEQTAATMIPSTQTQKNPTSPGTDNSYVSNSSANPKPKSLNSSPKNIPSGNNGQNSIFSYANEEFDVSSDKESMTVTTNNGDTETQVQYTKESKDVDFEKTETTASGCGIDDNGMTSGFMVGGQDPEFAGLFKQGYSPSFFSQDQKVKANDAMGPIGNSNNGQDSYSPVNNGIDAGINGGAQ